ncbi:TetR family transcriptional regulator [Devosia oryziradicis]|uniref:TetR family transcriptional regulator n=1 Tax=Devosia oryziradicis TaxID=2801335 RepID=A0ABX7BZ73_9HYPH|nr:TetR/AcrR family transcriptional regulator [Devosia oryziradicis]QQR37264.1 TetR family transcriptional regulator [Devosia oryziradicis]
MFELQSVRKVPVQPRAKARQELILRVAEELIAEKGSDAMSMNEIAVRAGISIGSLYQYYRDKSAVIGALGLLFHAESSACIEQEFAAVDSAATLRDAFIRLMAIYFDLLKQSPAMRDVWLAIQSDKSLHGIEMEANTRNGALLAAAMNRASPSLDAEVARVTAYAVMALGESAMRLAIGLPGPDAESVVQSYTRMALGELERLVTQEPRAT